LSLDRRHFLATGLALPLVSAAFAEEVKQWPPAEHFPIWPSSPPGSPAILPEPHTVIEGTPSHPAPKLSGVAQPELHVFRPEQPNGAAILVLPGGSYARLSVGNEGVDVAIHFNNLGYSVFMLTYRLPGDGWQRRSDVPLQDAQRAIRLIRRRAAEFSLDPARVGVLGFSAGGHLAASLTTMYDEPVYPPIDAADKLPARPMFSGLLYPVIDMSLPFAHQKSRDNLLGQDPSPQLIAARSPQLHVTPETPPVFLAHALDDRTVMPDNSLLMLAALREKKVAAELHLFELGDHGFALQPPTGATAALWPELFRGFLVRHAG
jgi:acetyl esterase/lipase